MITALKRYYWKYLDGLWCRRRFGLKDLKHAREFRCGRKRWSAEGGTLSNGPDEKIRRARARERIKTLGLPEESGQSACATGHLCERPGLSAANPIEAAEALVKA